MNNELLVNMDDMQRGGSNVVDLASRYGAARKKIEETVASLKASYPSEDGLKLAEAIDGYRETLNNMQRRLDNVGQFAIRTGKVFTAANDDIKNMSSRI